MYPAYIISLMGELCRELIAVQPDKLKPDMFLFYRCPAVCLKTYLYKHLGFLVLKRFSCIIESFFRKRIHSFGFFGAEKMNGVVFVDIVVDRNFAKNILMRVEILVHIKKILAVCVKKIIIVVKVFTVRI